MQISLKNTIITSIICTVVGIAIGYYSLPAKIVTETKIQTEMQVVHDTQTIKHDNIVTVVTKAVDGSTITTTKDLSVESDQSEEISNENSTAEATSTKSYDKGTLNIGALSTIDLSNGRISYGAYLTKSVLGPFTLGLQVTNSPAFGIMVGLSF